MDREGSVMQAAWKSRRFTNLVRYLLDDWMPPVLREWRPLARVLARTFHGQHFDIDFKLKAFHLTEGEFAAAYSRLQGGHTEPYRLTDMTPGQLDWLTAHALGPNVLEVGCGFGVLAERLAGRGDLQ